MTVKSITKDSFGAKRIKATPERTAFWLNGLAFSVGFCIQFNVLVGGNGEGFGVIGGYGFRLSDFITVGIIGLFGLYVLNPRRMAGLAVFALIVGAVVFLRTQAALFGEDRRTDILFIHYVAYSFVGVYMAIILRTVTRIDSFCWGLIVGLLVTVPVFVLEAAGYSSALTQLGLIPEYGFVLSYYTSDILRYAGLWVHPNEASHVAALSAAAGAYFVFVHRRFLPLVLTAAGLLAVFYYTQSRGGLIAGGVVLAIPLLFRAKKQNIMYLAVGLGLIAAIVLLISQLDIVAYRFADDATAGHNFNERIASTFAALQLLLSHPFGMSDAYFISMLATATGGVESPHNGFVYFGAVFGIIPLLILIFAIATNLRSWNREESFFALLALQVSISFMFEELPISYCYALVLCLLIGRMYLKTRIGHELMARSAAVISRQSVRVTRRIRLIAANRKTEVG